MPQQIIWTALPNGFRTDSARRRIRLSVFVSPRLRFDGAQTTGTLDAFPDFLDWPAQLQPGRMSFNVFVEDGGPIPAFAAPAQVVTSPEPDSGLWKTLFGPSTLVRAHEFEGVPQEPVSSYPASKVATTLTVGYRTVGQTSPYAAPSKTDLANAFGDVHAAVTPGTGGAQPSALRVQEIDALSDAEITQLHRDLGDTLLRRDPGMTFYGKLAAVIESAGRLARSSAMTRPVPVVPPTARTSSAFAQFAAFHRRLPAAGAATADIATATPNDVRNIDFHRTLSVLGEYPDLIRRLGLVIDLELSDDGFPESRFGDLKGIMVAPARNPAGTGSDDRTPVTKYIYDVRPSGSPFPFPVFSAAPRRAAEAAAENAFRDLEIVGGLLNLRIPTPEDVRTIQFDILQVDVDGGASKLLNVIDGIVHDQQNPQRPIDSSDDAAAPALRTSGLSLVRAKYADTLMSELAKANDHEEAMRTPGKAVELFAEDLVRGYRFDVRRFPAGFPFDAETPPPMPPWMSLHRRTESFVFHRSGATDVTLSGISNEGFLQPSYAQDIKDPSSSGATSPIFIHESICHWQGWSLSASRPANPMVLGATPPPATTADAPMLTQVDVAFAAAPGSLPRLRFGDFYQLRARIVDLAGNGATLEGANEVQAALETGRAHVPVLPIHPQEFRYRRFEPIAAPVLVPRSQLTEGEALDVLVIRSNGSSAAAYAASLHDAKYSGINERHVVPPKSSQVMVEMHGLLDGAFGTGGDPLRFFKICQREAGTLNDPAVVNVETGELEQLPDVTVVDPNTGAQTRHRNGISFVAAGTGADSPTARAAGYTIHYEPRLRIPYLPDPLARGASMFGLPGVVGQSAVLDQNGSLVFTGAEGELLPQKAINALGCVTKIDFARSDKWWEPLPFRLRLDENTGSPDSALPEWDRDARVLTVRLAPGETRTVWLSSFPDPGDIALFGLHAWWSERLGATAGDREFLGTAPHGALSMLTPARRLTLVHGLQQPLIAPAETPLGSFGVRRFENDTLAYIGGGFTVHGLSTAKIDLFATWTEPGDGPGGSERRTVTTHVLEFPIHLDAPSGSINDNPVPIARYDNDIQVVRFFAPDAAAATVDRRWLARHEFGDTKFRNVIYRVVATTRHREYFPDRITSSPDNLTRSVQFQKIVPSTARPPAPEVSHIVPAFQWLLNVDPSTADVTMSRRRGGALRVYLGSSWHASGDGEQLAIVGSPDWGEDPIHSAPMQTAGSVEPSVGMEAGVFPYPVAFDKARGLWFCDLTFAVAGLYFPFVKLTLARYQKNSLPGLALSPTVEAGIYQLTPDRSVVLTYQDTLPGDPSHRRINISVQGDAASAAQLPAASRSVGYSVEVMVERRAAVPQADEDLGWTPASAAEQPVPDTPTPGQPVLWVGHVLVPRFADGERRIVVKEFQLYGANSCQTGQGWIGDPAVGASRRLVYADTIPVL